MFGSRSTKNLMSIHDDRAGEGDALAFPTMSSCAAIICVLDDRLVGVHKVMGAINGHQTKLFDYARDQLIRGDAVHMIVISGWQVTADDTTKHSPTAIRNALGCQDVATFIYSYGDATGTYKTGKTKRAMAGLCTLASHNGTGFPYVSVKRTAKVTNTMDGAAIHNLGSAVEKNFGSVAEDVTTSHDHLINRNKFTQI